MAPSPLLCGENSNTLLFVGKPTPTPHAIDTWRWEIKGSFCRWARPGPCRSRWWSSSDSRYDTSRHLKSRLTHPISFCGGPHHSEPSVSSIANSFRFYLLIGIQRSTLFFFSKPTLYSVIFEVRGLTRKKKKKDGLLCKLPLLTRVLIIKCWQIWVGSDYPTRCHPFYTKLI